MPILYRPLYPPPLPSPPVSPQFVPFNGFSRSSRARHSYPWPRQTGPKVTELQVINGHYSLRLISARFRRRNICGRRSTGFSEVQRIWLRVRPCCCCVTWPGIDRGSDCAKILGRWWLPFFICFSRAEEVNVKFCNNLTLLSLLLMSFLLTGKTQGGGRGYR